MYLQITTRCNMTCPHCAYACNTKGVDMSLKTFEASLDFIKEYSSVISIGGGEPTLHPKFWEILTACMAEIDEGTVWLATNGSNTKISLRLAKLARKCVISCDLSIDEYHSEIDEEVVKAFKKPKIPSWETNIQDCRNIRTVTKIVPRGRATETGVYTEQEGCVCEDIFIAPDGKIRWCGCEEGPEIGNVFDGIYEDYQEAFNEYGHDVSCYKKIFEEE